MKKLHWFTKTNIACKESKKLEFDLTDYIEIFIERQLWNKPRYRTEYNYKFEKSDLEKIKSLKLIIHTETAPYSNLHEYESVINEYLDVSSIEKTKLFSSGISEANKIAVIIFEFETKTDLPKNLSYEQEKDIEFVFGNLTDKNQEALEELQCMKSIVCEFIQFFTFNLHLNFLTHHYTFSINDKATPIGFTVTSENGQNFYETEKHEFLSHYILYSKDNDNLSELMKYTSKFWCTNITSIHFFLDALKGNYITSTNFTKLVFTLESFFGKNISNDYISLVVPLITSKNISEMKFSRELIKKSFLLRNEIVHGNSVINFLEDSLKKMKSNNSGKEIGIDTLYFDLKNLIIKIFYFYINNNLYSKEDSIKINHELIFKLLPHGIT
jgi:hypothetical protein